MKLITEKEQSEISFPLSQKRKINGKRRLLRQKVLQILTSYEISESPLELLFNHIFFRDFIIDEDVQEDPSKKLLNPQEIIELESDARISWPSQEQKFASQLIQCVIKNSGLCEEIIIKASNNWEYDRIAYLDKKIMAMAICEFLFFPDVPIKVTINEAIDLGKEFSTEKSGTFINGVLDRVIDNLNSENKIEKSGKGLKE